MASLRSLNSSSAAAAFAGIDPGVLPSPADHAPHMGPSDAQATVNASSGPKTVVIKIGSASLSSSDGRYLHQSKICSLVEEVCRLREQGHRVIVVTSGAVSVGCLRMKLDRRPESGSTKQAIAAVGQSRLMRVYDDFFSHLGQPIAQVLLSRENFGNRRSYTNVYNTFQELLNMGVVPLVNENDTVSLRTGDNDTLSALVATLVDANWLFLLTDVDGLYTANPQRDPEATRIPVVSDIDKLQVDVGGSGQWGTGGMATKISAARISTSAGITTVVCHSDDPRVISQIMSGSNIGTVFLPSRTPIKGKKKWIAHGTVPGGVIMLDEGAIRAVHAKKSLFAAGIMGVEGHFSDTDTIILVNLQRVEIARGLTNFSSAEMQLILGQPSQNYAECLGYSCADEVIHRDNLVLLSEGRYIPAEAFQLCDENGPIGARRGFRNDSDSSDDERPSMSRSGSVRSRSRGPKVNGSASDGSMSSNQEAQAVAVAAAVAQLDHV